MAASPCSGSFPLCLPRRVPVHGFQRPAPQLRPAEEDRESEPAGGESESGRWRGKERVGFGPEPPPAIGRRVRTLISRYFSGFIFSPVAPVPQPDPPEISAGKRTTGISFLLRPLRCSLSAAPRPIRRVAYRRFRRDPRNKRLRRGAETLSRRLWIYFRSGD